jgi:hypothetical protein
MLLEELLRDKTWYSRSFNTIYDAYNSNLQGIIEHLYNLSIKLEEENDRINIFSYDGEVFIGLESRRLDYEREVENEPISNKEEEA